MVDGGDDPRQSQSQEHVDGVAAGHVTDGVVRCLLSDGRDLAGEGVRQGRPQRHEGDGGDLIREGGLENIQLQLTSLPHH